MDLQRLARHLLSTPWRVRRAFPATALAEIEAAVAAAESTHGGEIRFAVEDALEPWALLRGQTPRERAVEVFSQLRVWDTQDNNGVLIYLLLAERAIEIVTDRGLGRHADTAHWQRVMTAMREAFRAGQFEAGLNQAVDAVDALLTQHFPLAHGQVNPNELSNAPVVR